MYYADILKGVKFIYNRCLRYSEVREMQQVLDGVYELRKTAVVKLCSRGVPIEQIWKLVEMNLDGLDISLKREKDDIVLEYTVRDRNYSDEEVMKDALEVAKTIQKLIDEFAQFKQFSLIERKVAPLIEHEEILQRHGIDVIA